MEEPFAWGSHDCALFSASAVNAMCGVDPAAAFRGTYDTQRGAAEALKEHGEGTLLKTVRAWFPEEKSVHLAHRGDLVMKDATAVGICVGRYSWFVGREQGMERLVPVPTRDCRYAFTVPFAPPATREGEA